ncbi:hypothetical protein CAPTEDRAFT_172316 [Capitella teleta]|uniref:Non-specific serine/threonine protein kinase n=1 Tax=Capitella teleta TaxID=283909 RepID=R7UKB6_CAPTE|nr:hypothetical protein CAPTEDRAFT_172316 [Capitella teleta]|eukprot:ELU03722.1 hypothetical protein CAPTEDRAFT_172316 [Capitella teleta]
MFEYLCALFQVYKVVVEYAGRRYFIFRRYNEFLQLQERVSFVFALYVLSCDVFDEFREVYIRLKKLFPDAQLKLPGKKLFGNLDPEVIKNRREALSDFIQRIITSPAICEHPEVRSFLNLESVDRSQSSDEDDEVDSLNSVSDAQSANGSSSMESLNRVDLGPSERQQAKSSDFEFLKVIGKGSFGKVLLAKHKNDGKIWAVKVLNKAHIMKKNEAKHIMSERNVLVKNVTHPFLVGLHYSFQTPDKLYFVLDYVNGGELFFHLQKERCFSESRARFYAAEMASALGYLHSLNVIYRDLKPENILLDKEGHLVLTDFGLCKEDIAGRDTTSTFCGTPEYLAPEVLRKQPYDRTVDWWCLGAVLFEMIYGLPPFYSRDTSEMYDNILHKPLRFKNNAASPTAKNLLEGLLQKDKEKRLGAKNDSADIRSHSFFSAIDWKLLESRKIKPPFIPNVSGHMDLRNFDPEFVREPVPASVGKSATGGGKLISASVIEADNAFQGFSYVPPADEYL